MKLFLAFLLGLGVVRAQVISTSPPVDEDMVLIGNGTALFSANAALLAQTVPLKVANMAALRALVPADGMLVDVAGYYTPGDGGGTTYVLTNSITGTNAYGGKVVAFGGAKSWLLSDGVDALTPQLFGGVGDTNFDSG